MARSFLERLLAGFFGEQTAEAQKLAYDREVGPELLRVRYKRNGVARALVDARPDATWAGEITLLRGDEPEDGLAELWRTFRLDRVLFRADLAAEITGFAGIVVPGQDLTLPPTREEALGFPLAVYGYDQITPVMERGTLKEYQLRVSREGASGEEVHPQRVLPVADVRYSESSLVGHPRMLSAWDLLTDLERVVGGGSLAFRQGVFGLRQLNFGKDAKPSLAQQAALQEQFRQLDDDTSKFLITAGAELSMHAPTAVSFQADANLLLTLVASAFRVPLTVVTGEALVSHSASTALTDWQNRIDERRQAYAAPDITAPTVAWLESITGGRGGVFTAEERTGIGVQWPLQGLGDYNAQTSAILNAVREGVLDAQRGLELLPEQWFGPEDQRLLGDGAAPAEADQEPPEGEPFVAPVDDDGGFGPPSGGEG